jgi:hypothetical protein
MGEFSQGVPAWVGIHSGKGNGRGFDDVGRGSPYFSVH